METQFLLETGNNVQIPYLKYTMLIILYCFFPSGFFRDIVVLARLSMLLFKKNT